MAAMTDRVVVGSIAGSYGVNGEVRLKSFCAEPEAIADYRPLIGQDGREFAMLVLTGQVKGGFTARIAGIETKEQADALKGTQLYARRDQLPDPGDDEFYYTDLIGLPVFDTGGAELGQIKSVIDHGAGDLLEIQLPMLSETVFLPFTKANVPTVDLGAGRLVADPPEGIFPDS